MGKVKKKNKELKNKFKSKEKKEKKGFKFKNELSLILFSFLGIAESLQLQSVKILDIGIEWFIYSIIFINVCRSIYKYAKYKGWVKKYDSDNEDF